MLYVPRKTQYLLRSSLPTSWGFVPLPKEGQQAIISPLPPSDKTPFQNLFAFVATNDNAPYLCIPEALKFRKDICGGEDHIEYHCYELAKEGGARVAEILGTEVMDSKEGSLTKCCMFNVRLPIDSRTQRTSVEEATLITAYMSWSLARHYDTFIPTFFHGNQFWARFSSQIYLDLIDFEWGAEVLKELCGRVNSGDHVGWKASS